MNSDTCIESAQVNPVQQRRWHRSVFWFLAGFCMAGTAMLLGFPTSSMDPAGGGVIRCSLWQYYRNHLLDLVEHHPLGTSSATSQTAILTLVLLSCSISGGLMGMGFGRIARKREKPVVC